MIRDELAPATDRARWQTQNLALIGDLIASGAAEGLASLNWTLTDIGLVRAEVPEGTPNPGAVFYTWATHLGTEHVRSSVFGGRIHMRATARCVRGTSVMVRLRAKSRQIPATTTIRTPATEATR